MTSTEFTAGRFDGLPDRRPGGGPGLFMTSNTTLAGAQIAITTPRGDFVGSAFTVSGVATVRMVTHEFIKAGGQGHEITFERFVTDGFRVKVRVGSQESSQESTADVRADGDRMRWSHRVSEVPEGRVDITAELDGTVQEISRKEVGGQEQSHTENVRVHETASAAVTVDNGGPALNPGAPAVSIGPPYRAEIKGTAQDPAGIKSVRWRFEGTSRSAEDLGCHFGVWEAIVPLPHRRSEHEIAIIAVDKGDHETTETVRILPDTTPPVLTITEPAQSPHQVTFVDGGITVAVRGMAADDESRLANLTVALDAGEPVPAEPVRPDWMSWQSEVDIGSAGQHFVVVRAVDAAGNAAEQVLVIEALA